MAASPSLLLAVLAASTGALAGHGLFEPKITGQPRSSQLGVSTLGASDSIPLTDSITANATIHKRWLGFKAGSGNADDKLWPGRKLRYCWESQATKDILNDDLIEAASRWSNSGLSDSGFTYQDVGIVGSASACTSDRTNVLLIEYSAPGPGEGQSRMATSVGKIPAGVGTDGPTMILTDDDTMGMLDRVANYAHELGHAWGLHHEHQNPFFWERAYGNQDGNIFGANNFNCQNLKDYDKVQAKIQAKIDADPTGLGSVLYGNDFQLVCTSRAKAKDYKFSAYDYLPIPYSELLVPSSSTEDVDWDSLMIYPSGGGGSGSASAGGPDNRAPILRQANGEPIAIHLNPSAGDVAGLQQLYAQEEVTDDGPLLDDPKNKKNNSKALSFPLGHHKEEVSSANFGAIQSLRRSRPR